MNYKQSLLKRNTELLLMSPFVFAGKLAGKLFKLKTQHRIFLFFPTADIGGSIKVNADIADCIKDAKPLIIFSKTPKDNGLKPLYDIEGVRIIDIHKYIDNKLFHFVNFFFRGVIASWINAARQPVVFGGESMYFYKIIPHVKTGTRCVELCHLNTWFDFSQAFIEYIDLRIFSSPQIKRDAEQQYKANNAPAKFFQRLRFIDNKVDIPPLVSAKNPVLEVLFAGRGASQKRVHLIAEIAKRMHASESKVHFSFVGDVGKIIPEEVKPYVTLYGSLSKDELYNTYARADVLLLTSSFEGLPIVVMDMMARGKVVVSTAVGGIPDYIIPKQTGFLITETGEDKIVSKAIEYLNELIENEELRVKIGQSAYQYALAHFSAEKFCSSYRNILLG
jgi:glycosyltransferase involved in cell wall biosynthesis